MGPALLPNTAGRKQIMIDKISPVIASSGSAGKTFFPDDDATVRKVLSAVTTENSKTPLPVIKKRPAHTRGNSQ
jgi:hypothetical protein